jgi:protein tyrosine phosphatase
MIDWVIPHQLARASRPGYVGGLREQVAPTSIDRWVDDVKNARICSIICLLADEHLSLYAALPDGLINHYRQCGFQVEHIPVPDHQRPAVSKQQLAAIIAAANRLPQPLLVHCSAGIDRTGLVVEQLRKRWMEAS